MDTLILHRKDNYVIIEMNNGKVNAINAALSRDLKEAFQSLEQDDSVAGVILAGRPHGFSAGIDMMSLATGGPEGVREFWWEYHSALQAMIKFSKPFVCAITGYAPAGGTILALCADYRVMGKGTKHVIGMHELKLSMVIPDMMGAIYAYHMGEKRAWKYVQESRLFHSDDALEVGLVDESVEVEEVLGRAEKHLHKLMATHLSVFKASKAYFRKGLLDIANQPLEPMVDIVAKGWEDPFVQATIKKFLASLKK